MFTISIVRDKRGITQHMKTLESTAPQGLCIPSTYLQLGALILWYD